MSMRTVSRRANGRIAGRTTAWTVAAIGAATMMLAMVSAMVAAQEVTTQNNINITLPPALRNQGVESRTERDPRVRELLRPMRIIWMSETGVERAEELLRPDSGQITLSGGKWTRIERGAGVVLDFGFELQGGVRIAVAGTSSGKPVRLRVRFGESVSETMSEPKGNGSTTGPESATNDHAIRDQTTLVPWLGTAEIGNTGFRFVRIDCVDEADGASVNLQSVQAIFRYRDLPYLGSFRCSDERLNQIWDVGAYTVHLNMQEYLWDGIKRDRLVWIGDMHPETSTISAVFGRSSDVVEKSLDLIRDETPPTQWMNGISSYSMWWILIHQDWYQMTGDREYLLAQQKYMTSLLHEFTKYVGDDNREKLPNRFLDWPSSGDEKALHAGLQSLLTMTFDAGVEMGDVFGDVELVTLCRDHAARLRRHVPDPGESKQGAALMVLAGIGDAVKLNRDVMAVGGAKRMSTFYGYYVLEARAQVGDVQGCLDCIRDYWGAMLDNGATTFWEDFDIEWTENAAPIDELVPEGKRDLHGDFGNHCYVGLRHSLCHGWASGPTAWMSRHVLGINPQTPGCTKVRVSPQLGDLEWVEGTFPTPHGVIHVRHEKQPDGSMKSTIDAPPGVEVVQ